MNQSAAGMEQGIEFGSFRLFPAKRLLETNGAPIAVGSRALDILILLVEREGEVVSKKELLAHAWPGITVDESSLRVHIAGLRKSLSEDGGGANYIKNVPGRGYCFVEPTTRLKPAKQPEAEPGARRDYVPGLPPQLGRMVGRDETVQKISELLDAKRFVTVHGPGGIGKTTTAISVGHAQLGAFAGAVQFVDLGHLSEARFLPSALASIFGLSVQSSDPTSNVLAFLRNRRMLLIFDSCEHLIDPVAALAERIFHEAPEVNILATSRETLQVEGEYVYRLPALECPSGDAEQSAKQVLSFSAPHLFVERVAASGQQFELTDADAPVVAEICRKLDGIALAIELAAAQVSTHGLRETAALLDNRLRLRWHGRRTALARHQTLTAALNWSYDLLNEAERKVFRCISIFVGPFTLEAACEVAGDESIDHLQVAHIFWQLVAKSLLTLETGDGTTLYRLLDTTRGYAFEKLVSEDESDQAAGRLAQYYLKMLDTAGISADWKKHLGNIRTALEWSLIEARNIELGVALAAASTRIFIELSLFSECLYWTEQSLAVIDTPSLNTRRELELQAAFALSLMLVKGHDARAHDALIRGLELAEVLQDPGYRFRILARLHFYYRRTGDIHRLFEIAERAETAAKQANEPPMVAAANSLLGVSTHLTGEQSSARKYFEAALRLPVRTGAAGPNDFEFEFQPRAKVALARILWLTGYPDRAVQTAQQAADHPGAQVHPVTYCVVMIWGVSVFHWVGDLLSGERVIDRLITHAEHHGLATYFAAGNAHKGRAMVMRGHVEEGIALMRSSLEGMHRNAYELYSIELNCFLAEELAKSGRLDESLAIVEADMETARQNGHLMSMPELLRIRGQLLRQAANEREAEDCFHRSLELAGQQSALSWQLRTSKSLAQLLRDQGRFDEAPEILRSTYERFSEGFDTADLKEAKRLLAELDGS